MKRTRKYFDPEMETMSREKLEALQFRRLKLQLRSAIEILIMPTQAMREEEKDYALACALPMNAPGVILIFGRQTNEERKCEEGFDAGNPQFGLVGGEALIIFEDVFVPWERVFLCGEYDLSGLLVERFATLHRQNYGGCKGGVSDVLIGASALAAEFQGTAGASHIKEKLAEMVHLAETSTPDLWRVLPWDTRLPRALITRIPSWPIR